MRGGGRGEEKIERGMEGAKGREGQRRGGREHGRKGGDEDMREVEGSSRVLLCQS